MDQAISIMGDKGLAKLVHFKPVRRQTAPALFTVWRVHVVHPEPKSSRSQPLAMSACFASALRQAGDISMACFGLMYVMVTTQCSQIYPSQHLCRAFAPLLTGLVCIVPHMLSKRWTAVPSLTGCA